MKKHIAALALGLAALTGTAQAAMVNLTQQYRIDHIGSAVGSAVGLSTGSTFFVNASFDDVNLEGGAVTILPGSLTDSFGLQFGNLAFNAASDNFGGPVLQAAWQSSGWTLTGLLFEAMFEVAGGAAAGEYLLSFSGDAFQLTPSGNTSDFVGSGVQVVPLPAVLPMLLAGLGLFGVLARHKPR